MPKERSYEKDKSSSDVTDDQPIAPGTERPAPGHPGGPPVRPTGDIDQPGDKPINPPPPPQNP